MGILGLHSAYEFSERLFNSFDNDNDNKVNNLLTSDFFSRFRIIYVNSKKNILLSIKTVDSLR